MYMRQEGVGLTKSSASTAELHYFYSDVNKDHFVGLERPEGYQDLGPTGSHKLSS